MSEAVLSAIGVGKTFGEGSVAARVLRGIDLAIAPGELTLLMGPSGSGKTTLVSILTGLLRPTVGQIRLCGAPISEMPDHEVAKIRRQRLGFVFQTYNLFPALTAVHNVAIAYRLKGFEEDEACCRAAAALEGVGLADRLLQRPDQLSAGQKQRVAIARALAGDPRVIVGDEPTAALDTENAMAVMELLRSQVSSSVGVLLVTHDHRLERFAHRVIELEDGRVVRDARVSEQCAGAA